MCSLVSKNLSPCLKISFPKPLRLFKETMECNFKIFPFESLQIPRVSFTDSCPYTSSQNGVVERKHRHLADVGRCPLFTAGVSLAHWLHAFQTTCFLINRIPSSLESPSPCKLRFGNTPNLSHSKVGVCVFLFHTHHHQTN